MDKYDYAQSFYLIAWRVCTKRKRMGPFVPRKGWAEMIKKVYEIDPLLCPHCGGQMSIIAFIEDHKG